MPSYLDLIVARIADVFRAPRENPELIQAKLASLARQVPMMYALLIVNITALAITFYGTAPTVLTVYLPIAFDVTCITGAATWIASRRQVHSLDQAIQRLRATVIYSAALGTAGCAWGLALFRYGDTDAQGHVAFFMAVTTIVCFYCLMHLRAAALTVMVIVVIPFAVFFGSSQSVVLQLLALNFVVVAIVVSIILLGNYSDFEQRIASEKSLRFKQAELQLLNDRNFRNSNTDSLTGLPNRRNFFAELERSMAVAAAHGDELIVAILDLDRFKPINDVHGHRLGDRLLIEVADRIRAHLPPHAFLGRLGSDEFALFSRRRLNAEDIERSQSDLANIFSTPFEIGGVTVKIGYTSGYAQFPEAARTAEALFECAGYALFFGKEHARGKATRFSAEHEASIRQASLIDQALVQADLERELWIAYQPIVDVTTQCPVSFEALARWASPALGNVSPMNFIVAAERSGMIDQLTPLLLRKALEGAATWPEHVRISFNLSAVDVASPLSILKIITVVRQSGVTPSRIDFEITETAVMHDLAHASQSLNALRALGARISLDDFGTGYSSLSCIRELPLDKVKIDRSFIDRIETDHAARLILQTMIGLCTGLGLDCIVEGVENCEQAAFLRDEDCRFMQGYHFARPMSIDRVHDYLALTGKGTSAAIISQA